MQIVIVLKFPLAFYCSLILCVAAPLEFTIVVANDCMRARRDI